MNSLFGIGLEEGQRRKYWRTQLLAGNLRNPRTHWDGEGLIGLADSLPCCRQTKIRSVSVMRSCITRGCCWGRETRTARSRGQPPRLQSLKSGQHLCPLFDTDGFPPYVDRSILPFALDTVAIGVGCWSREMRLLRANNLSASRLRYVSNASRRCIGRM
jgi:hypothetical protein